MKDSDFEKLKDEVESELGEFSWEELDEGLNTVFRISSDRDLIVKVRTNPRNEVGWFRAESEIYKLLQDSDIPSPEILYTNLSEETVPAFYVMEMLSGNNLERIKDAISQERLENVLYDYGEILARIHEMIKFESYGRIEAEGGKFDIGRKSGTWPGYILEDMKHWKTIVEDEWSEPPEIEVPDSISSKIPQDPGSALIHSDNRLNNVLVEGSQITGFIDWSHPVAGSRKYDLARAEYLLIEWDLTEREDLDFSELRESLWNGYRTEKALDPEWENSEERQIYRYATTLWLAAAFANWGQNLGREEHQKYRERIIRRVDKEEPKDLLN